MLKSRTSNLLILSVLLLPMMTHAQVSSFKVKANEFIIKMKTSPSSGNSVQSQQKAAFNKGLSVIGSMGKDVQIKKSFSNASLFHVNSSSSAKIQFLKNHPDVEFVEPNYIQSVDPVQVEDFGVAPDPLDEYTQSYSNVQVTEAWAVAKPYNQGTRTIIAVIDSGLDLSHHVFADSNSIWENTSERFGSPGVDDDGNGYIDDINGWNFVDSSGSMYDDNDHGTHVAGIVLGVGQDITADPVRESRLKIMPIKFLDGFGSGTTSDAISAIYYAVNMGAKVINNSWGGPSYSRALHEAYTYAYNNGVVIVSAAGNSGVNIESTPMYPAALDTPSNITVAATTDSDNKASFSNFSTSLVHVAAPGVAIVSTVPGSCSGVGCFQMLSGTSMAAPFVAGLAGLVIREAPQLSAYQIKAVILGTADIKSSLSTRVQSSARVNVLSAVQNAISNAATLTWSPSYSPAYTVESRSVASESSSSGGGGGCGLVKAIADDTYTGRGPMNGSAGQIAIIFVLILIPLVAAVKLRSRQGSTQAAVAPSEVVRPYQRQYERFKVAKDIAIKIGDQVIQSASDSISVGGLSFSASEQSAMSIEKGQRVTLRIGEHADEIEAEIVWCSQKNSFGVKFLQITDSLKNQMNSWTMGLNPA